ncbi:sensor domain-containing diguanylate cyclase [Vibrio sinaloensis]|uniref:diguanylate cyclase n=1 Tax=Photobacterium sp. (strain ATCC 43367) TaxID=379097 RepID=A0A0A5HMY8_PHOS4|nr:diguanylate cyclase [Vibrio sinaloensis]
MNSTFSKAIATNPSMINSVFESLPEPTFLINKSGIYVEAWGGRDTKRHHNPDALVGLTQYQVLPADKAVWFSQVIVDVIESQKPSELEYSLDPKDLSCFDGVEGPTDVQHFSALVIPLPNTELVLWTVRNITEYKRALDTLARQQLELEKLTYMDHLTQLYNRYALDVLLPDAIELTHLRQTHSAILMIDIDCFKQYNDHYGHIQGDRALIAIGQAIQGWAGSNELCFRYGGDEFLVYLSGLSQDDSLMRAKMLRQSILDLNIPHEASTVANHLTITIGIKFNQAPDTHTTAEKIVALADKALFHAKNQQRGTIHQLT